MSHRSRLSRIVRAKSMKEILKLCDGFVTGPTPQVTSILIYGSECFIQYVSSDFNVLFVTDGSYG